MPLSFVEHLLSSTYELNDAVLERVEYPHDGWRITGPGQMVSAEMVR